MNKALRSTFLSLIFNSVFCAYHIILGINTPSLWLFTVGIYYAILSIMRFVVLHFKNTKQFSGIMLILLSVSLVGVVILAFIKERGTQFHLIPMLAIAVYAFTKIILATIKWIRVRKQKSLKLRSLRNISFAAAFVSIFSLQRSMLVTFDGMTDREIRLMNILTGSGVCIIVFLLGLDLLKNKKPD